MKCKWEQLTSGEFAEAAQAVGGVCVVPLGVLEKHGDHLPLGTDLLNIRCVAERAVAIEPAILFPPLFFGQIQEARHWPGTFAMPGHLLLALLETACEEIARNGLRKILLLSGHGGNNFLDFFLFTLLERPRDYVVYKAEPRDFWFSLGETPEWKAMAQSEFDYHGGERETSVALAAAPDSVRMDLLAGSGQRQGRLDHLGGLRTSMWWYADFPDHYAGDAAHATAEKGEFLVSRCAECVAGYIRAVKGDAVSARLQAEYFSRTRHGPGPSP